MEQHYRLTRESDEQDMAKRAASPEARFRTTIGASVVPVALTILVVGSALAYAFW